MRPTWDQVLFTAWNNRHLDVAKLAAKSRLNSWDDRDQWMNTIKDCEKKLS